VKDACGALIMSGTLSPLKLFSEVLGLEGAEMQTYSAIASPKNVRTMIDLSVTTSFAERNHEMVSHIGERISWLIPKIPNGALVFFPQRRFMLNALDNWKESGLIKEMDGSSILGGKSVFIEGIHATENRKIVEDYKKVSRIANGAILFGVFRGRNAEGSNFPDEEARGIFLVGIPYADFSNPVVNAQISYLEEKRPGLGKNWYIMDAFRAVNQAMGRGIRHRNDWCNFILMDKRYETKQDFLPKWVVANGVQIIERRRYPSFKEY
jgi:Rad3-related DNA helicase